MRKLLPLVLAGAVGLGVSGTAFAVAMSGQVGVNNCTAGMDPTTLGAELYGFKIKSGGAGYDDILADLTIKQGSVTRVGGAIVTNPPTWGLPDNFRLAEAPDDVIFAVVTFNDGSMTVNSGDVASTSGGNQGLSHKLAVGANIPDTWGVRNGQPAGTLPATDDGNGGVDFRFAPWPEVTGDGDTFGPPSCRIGGHDATPGATNGQGVIAGYNVYRIPDGGTTPTAQTFYNAATDGSPATGGFLYFVNFRTLNSATADGPGPPDSDTARLTDLAGLFNVDSAAYTGDDTVVFQDSANTPGGTPRAVGTAPVSGTTYWYAVQPVVGSMMISALDGTSLSSSSSWTAAGLDRVPGGGMDSIDLDGDGTIEFFSPQADAGIGGFGLTNDSLPLLSPPVQHTFVAAAATGDVTFTGEIVDGDVNLQFAMALEAGNVLGFNVYRHQGDVRLPVNSEPILASGGEGSVYTLVDDLGQSSRRLRRGTLTYSVDVVYNDGTPTRTVGPFTIGSSDESSPVRRRR